ncbi:peptide-methionine (S)-S-oxide reductase MsrA [Flavobacterium sp. P4023]|uniref:Peptide methionine sulfoxide reductase MsrA n=1 Tax=Flavobacterium flabelliforme TaxID=2816119 RepID=A0ABS5CWQ5_9FLAO|nr:peptide-methionine (S)-S-oxide reductase MsrA [Flavobacterium flabelliforme]
MKKIIGTFLALVSLSSCAKQKNILVPKSIESKNMETKDRMEVATFAGGCFWCTEAVFLELSGVKSVVSGYIGGKTLNPTYKEISNGDTGHAEAIEITFDPAKISFGELLEIFFATHDPTTLNRQGNDIGTQYRSEIFYNNPDQKQLSEDYIALMTTENTFGKPIVTKITPASTFYVAEEYHQNYYNQNKTQGYCSYVITPKIDKLKKLYQEKLKK